MRKRSKIMLHPPLIPQLGRTNFPEFETHFKELKWCWDQIVDIVAKGTGHSTRVVRNTIDREMWFDADAAKDWKLVDFIDDRPLMPTEDKPAE